MLRGARPEGRAPDAQGQAEALGCPVIQAAVANAAVMYALNRLPAWLRRLRSLFGHEPGGGSTVIEVMTVSNGHLNLPLRDALQGFGGPLRHVELARPHPAAAYNRTVASVADQLTRVLDALDVIETRSPIIGAPPSKQDRAPLLREYRDLTYRLAEHYETLSRLPETLGATRAHRDAKSKYDVRIKSCRRLPALICNAMKHDHNQLLHVQITYPWNEVVHGFSLYDYKADGSLGPNKNAFPGRFDTVSFNLNLRAEVRNFLVADRAAASFCRALNTAPEKAVAPSSSKEAKPSALLEAIRRLDSRPEIGLQHERSQKIETVRFEGDSISFGLQPRRLPVPPPSRVRYSQSMIADGVTRTFSIADWPRRTGRLRESGPR
jgi:hypothetical protein